jgi:hypothetical protein
MKNISANITNQFWHLREFYFKNNLHSRTEIIHDRILFLKWKWRKWWLSLPYTTLFVGVSTKPLFIVVVSMTEEATPQLFRGLAYHTLFYRSYCTRIAHPWHRRKCFPSNYFPWKIIIYLHIQNVLLLADDNLDPKKANEEKLMTCIRLLWDI